MEKPVPKKIIEVMQNLCAYHNVTLEIRKLRFKDAAGKYHPGYAITTADERFARTPLNTFPPELGKPRHYEIATFEKMPNGVWYVKIFEPDQDRPSLYYHRYLGKISQILKPIQIKFHKTS